MTSRLVGGRLIEAQDNDLPGYDRSRPKDRRKAGRHSDSLGTARSVGYYPAADRTADLLSP